jgi:hypothetical protein
MPIAVSHLRAAFAPERAEGPLACGLDEFPALVAIVPPSSCLHLVWLSRRCATVCWSHLVRDCFVRTRTRCLQYPICDLRSTDSF